MSDKYSYWLPVEKMQDDHSDDVNKFVECYVVFHGVAGKCENCYAKKHCEELNEDELK